MAAIALLPPLAARFAPVDVVPPAPQILKMRFRDRTADVDPSSQAQMPPPTPLQGALASRAQDRVPGTQDTPFPAGAERGFEDALRAVRRDAVRSEKSLLTGRRESAAAGSAAGTTPHARTMEAPDETGALQFGDFAFSTTAWKWEPYWQHMRTKLYANWHPPAAYKDYGIIPGGWTMVRVVLDRNGHIRNCRIIGEKGHASLHPASFGAMQGAAPFRPLPVEFPDDSLVVTVRFMYLPPGATPEDPQP